jgi:ABC-type nitrate/sulfonate/bicarbonate transport system substrate-binding protein
MAEQDRIEVTWGHANHGGQHDWPFVMALQKGFFLAEGIDLHIQVVPGGDALAQAMGRGEIHIGRMGSPPFLTAIGDGVLAGKIIASSVIHNLDHFFFVVRPEIRDLSELRGTTVGVLSRGSCDGHLMKLALKQAGLDPDRDVRYRELREDYLKIDGLASGELSAQLTLEPLVSLGEHQGVLRIVAPVSRVAPHFHWGLLVAREDFIAEQPMLLRKLLRAYLKGAQYCVAHPDETKAMVCEYMPGYETAAVLQAVDRALPIWNTTGLIDMEGLAVAVETMCTLGAITQHLRPEALVDLSGLA